MKVTILGAKPEDVARAPEMIRQYLECGYADEGRTVRRKAVIYSRHGQPWVVSVWGDREHIRVAFQCL